MSVFKKKIYLLSNSTGNFDMLGLHTMQLRALINVIQLMLERKDSYNAKNRVSIKELLKSLKQIDDKIDPISLLNAKISLGEKKSFKYLLSLDKLVSVVKEKFNHLKLYYPIEIEEKILSNLDSFSVGISLLKNLENQHKDKTNQEISNTLEKLGVFEFYKMLIAIHNHCKHISHTNKNIGSISDRFLYYILSTLPPALNVSYKNQALDHNDISKALNKFRENADQLCYEYRTKFKQRPNENFTYIVEVIANTLKILEQDKIKSQARIDGKASLIKILLKNEEDPIKVFPNEKLEELFNLFHNVVTSINTIVANSTEDFQLFDYFKRFIEQIEKDTEKDIPFLNHSEIKRFIKGKVFNGSDFTVKLLGYVTPLESIIRPYLLINSNSHDMKEKCHNLLSIIRKIKSQIEEIEVYSAFYKKELETVNKQGSIEATIEMRAKSALALITDDNKKLTFLVNRNSFFYHIDNSDKAAGTEDMTYRRGFIRI